jgi:hypothetical protein
MDINKITAAHQDPVRAHVGKTAFYAALIRACASLRPNALVHDPVALKMFSFSSVSKGVPLYFCFLLLFFYLLPFTIPIFFIMKLVTKKDIRSGRFYDALLQLTLC